MAEPSPLDLAFDSLQKAWYNPASWGVPLHDWTTAGGAGAGALTGASWGSALGPVGTLAGGLLGAGLGGYLGNEYGEDIETAHEKGAVINPFTGNEMVQTDPLTGALTTAAIAPVAGWGAGKLIGGGVRGAKRLGSALPFAARRGRHADELAQLGRAADKTGETRRLYQTTTGAPQGGWNRAGRASDDVAEAAAKKGGRLGRIARSPWLPAAMMAPAALSYLFGGGVGSPEQGDDYDPTTGEDNASQYGYGSGMGAYPFGADMSGASGYGFADNMSGASGYGGYGAGGDQSSMNAAFGHLGAAGAGDVSGQHLGDLAIWSDPNAPGHWGHGPQYPGIGQ